MKLNVPTRDQVNDNVKGIFDKLKDKVGMIPNIYAFTGHSENTLKNYLTFSENQENGRFNAKEREAIFLAVSQFNGCDYCQSAHTALAKMNGFSEEETIQLRAGNHPDNKLQTLTKLAKEIAENRGKVADEHIQQFFDLGYDEEALVDLVSLVINVTFTNYIHNIANFDIDFPEAKPLQEAEPA